MTSHVAYVYKWTHLPTGRWYIGSRTARGCNPDDGYICSSKLVKPLIEQSPTEWKREIVATGDPASMLLLETSLLTDADARSNPLSFNQHNGDGDFSRAGVTTPEKTRRKQSEALKGDKHPRKGLPGPNLGRKFGEETRRKQREAKLGKPRVPHTEEAKRKIGDAKRGENHPNYGVPCPEELKQKLSLLHKGKPKIRRTCPHCGKEGGGGSMLRHHFDNCKQKEKINELD